MSTTTPGMRPIDRYFASYADDHRNVANQAIHLVAVPAIAWSVVALLWCLPPLITWFQNGVWAGLAMFAAWCFYNRLSRPLGLGMLGMLFVFGCLCRLLEAEIGLRALALLATGVFVLAWIAQFIGHRLEGRRPSFFTDLVYLLIGPAWVMGKLYQRLGLRY